MCSSDFVFRWNSTDFNPRAPRGARRIHHKKLEGVKVFQSTRSARSATKPPKPWIDPSKISIHALREERDKTNREALGLSQAFQSTRSARSATDHPVCSVANLEISIHALREERDQRHHNQHFWQHRHFNPRAPRGARPTLTSSFPPRARFQSTRSARSATAKKHKTEERSL